MRFADGNRGVSLNATELDLRAIVNAIPYPAMILDARHRVIDANMWALREEEFGHDACPLACHQIVHETDEPPADCPLLAASVSAMLEVRYLTDDVNGAIRVSVSPLDCLTSDGEPVFLHVMMPA